MQILTLLVQVSGQAWLRTSNSFSVTNFLRLQLGLRSWVDWQQPSCWARWFCMSWRN